MSSLGPVDTPRGLADSPLFYRTRTGDLSNRSSQTQDPSRLFPFSTHETSRLLIPLKIMLATVRGVLSPRYRLAPCLIKTFTSLLSLLQLIKIKNFLSKDTSRSENGIQPISDKKTFSDTNQKKNLIKNWTKTHHGGWGREKDIPTAIVCLT